MVEATNDDQLLKDLDALKLEESKPKQAQEKTKDSDDEDMPSSIPDTLAPPKRRGPPKRKAGSNNLN